MSRRQSRSRREKSRPKPGQEKALNEFQIGLAGAVLQSNQEHPEALRVLSDGLVREGRHEDALRVDLQLLALSPRDPIVHYNLACDYSSLEKLDQAFDMLNKAFCFGYRDYRHLLADRCLQNVRRDPRFRKLLDRRWGKRRP
jgi:tetratricopeptide (TPR) repeat protein